MPELPEVETLRRELARVLTGKIIKSAKILWPKTVAPFSPAQFERQIKNQKVAKLERQAKILIINFAGPNALAFHLKMTGQLIFKPQKGKTIVGGHPAPQDEIILPNSHTRLILNFTDGSTLYFNDLRKFGWSRLVNDSELQNLTKNIGISPLDKKFTDKVLSEIIRRFPNRNIKQILMDQSLIAGIGNIYADESCFLAKVLPTRKANALTAINIKNLRTHIVAVLKHSIQKKGTSSRNYRRSDGSLGGFVPYLFVYGRANQPCKVCQTPIKKIRLNGRGTHFCPKCQK